MIAKAQEVQERRRGERRKLFDGVAVTDVQSQEPLRLRDVSVDSFSVMSSLPFQHGAARQILFSERSGPAVTAIAIVQRCEKWPTEGTARYVVAFGFHSSDSANRTAFLGFAQALMRRTAVRSQY